MARLLPVILFLIIVGGVLALVASNVRQRVLSRQLRRRAQAAERNFEKAIAKLQELVDNPLTDPGTRQMLELAIAQIDSLKKSYRLKEIS